MENLPRDPEGDDPVSAEGTRSLFLTRYYHTSNEASWHGSWFCIFDAASNREEENKGIEVGWEGEAKPHGGIRGNMVTFLP